MPISDLLDAGFARELDAMRRRLDVRACSGAGGDLLARRRGGSAEFREHRPYAPGDDLRRIDWLAFARTGEPVFKLFRAEEDVIVRVVVDASASLDAGVPSKLAVAKKITASIAYLALTGSQRAQIVIACDGRGRVCSSARGRGSLSTILRELDALEARGGTDLAGAINDAVRRSARPGMLVIVSDFLDPGCLGRDPQSAGSEGGPFDTAITEAASAGHDMAFVQILAKEEIDPPYEGDLALEDVETGAIMDVTIDARAVEAYLERLNALIDALRRTARRHRATYVRAATADPLVSVIRRFVSRNVD